MKPRNAIAGCATAALMLLIGCSPENSPKDSASAPAKANGVTPDEMSSVQQKTDASEQWEYLVVSFGKTSFGDISENIVSGESKLAAFKEFSSLLAGYGKH